jgi:hypothetical protein
MSESASQEASSGFGENEENNETKAKAPKAYEIELDDQTKYHIKIGVSKYKQLKLQVREQSEFQTIYQAKFKYEELLEIDRFFGVFETMEAIVDEIDNLFVRNKVTISNDINNNLYMDLTISINNKERKIHLKLIRKGTEQTEALNNLVKLVSAQTKKLDNLQNENDELKKEIGKLQGKIKTMGGEDEENEDEESEEEEEKSKKKKKKKKKKVKKIEESEEDDDDEDNKKKKKKEENIGEFIYEEFLDNTSIIKEKKEIDLVLDKVRIIFHKSYKNFLNLKLLYSASKDGDSAEVFHSLCDGIAPLIVLIKTTKNVIFGGYTEAPYSFTKKRTGNKDDNAFIFSINKMKTYDVEKGTNATCSFRDYGPVFYGYEYCNIYLFGDFFNDEGNVAKKGDRYNTTEDFEINNGEQKFLVKELEVYQVYYKDIK